MFILLVSIAKGNAKILTAFGLNSFSLSFKTIELIIEDKPLQVNDKKIPKYKSVDILIGYNEVGLRGSIKACSGR